MFKILSLLFLMNSTLIDPGSIIMPENRFLKDAALIPQKLKLEGDSVRFSVKGSIPIESILIPKNPKITLSFKGEKNQLDLGEIDLKKNVSNYAYEKKIVLKYEPWMAGAVLEASFFREKKKINLLMKRKFSQEE